MQIWCVSLQGKHTIVCPCSRTQSRTTASFSPRRGGKATTQRAKIRKTSRGGCAEDNGQHRYGCLYRHPHRSPTHQSGTDGRAAHDARPRKSGIAQLSLQGTDQPSMAVQHAVVQPASRIAVLGAVAASAGGAAYFLSRQMPSSNRQLPYVGPAHRPMHQCAQDLGCKLAVAHMQQLI